jgi:hypothetical protein
MSVEDPTQRLTALPRDRSAAQTTAALPRPLDLAGPTPPAQDTPAQDPSAQDPSAQQPPAQTDELSLAEIFEAPHPPAAEQPTAVQPVVEEPVIEQPRPTEAAAEAPTWTAMPVIPVRSEPAPAAPERTAPSAADASPVRTQRTGPSTIERMRSDAAAAWNGALRRSQDWLAHEDNGLMLMTALVAIILILVVAAVGS